MTSTKPDYSNLSISELVSTYNSYVEEYVELSGQPKKTRTTFHDKADGIARCEHLYSSLVAWRESHAAADKAGEPGGPGETQKETVKVQKDAAIQETLDNAKRSKKTSEATQDQVKDNSSTDKGVSEMATKRKKKVNNGAHRGRAPSFPDDAKITILEKEPRKGEKTFSFKVFSAYRNGMTVKTLLEKVNDKRTRAYLAWDVEKKIISID